MLEQEEALLTSNLYGEAKNKQQLLFYSQLHRDESED